MYANCMQIHFSTFTMSSAKTAIILDTRRPLQDGTFPVKLRVTYQRKQKYYPTIYTVSEEEFEKIHSVKPRKDHKEKQLKFAAIERKAKGVIDKLPVFTFERFDRKFEETPVGDDVFSTFTQQIEKLQRAGRVGNASSYESASLSLLSYINDTPLTRNKGMSIKEAAAQKQALLDKRKPLPFSVITFDFLEKYERWMLHNGRSETTVGIYMRALRAVFNEAIANDIINKDLYPFGKREYQIPAGTNPKKYLTEDEFKKIKAYEPAHEGEAKYRDLFLFSAYCNGINIKDIARLKYRDIEGDKIFIVRAKTQRTTRKRRKNIEIIVTPVVKKIIERWGNKYQAPDTYIFPILVEGLTPEQERKKVQQATKATNIYLKRIAAAVGIEKNISSIVARHTWSTFMQRNNAPISMISDGLGHQDEKTTDNYLGGLDDNIKRSYAQLLADL
jgi:integrase/recombinase XerD